MECINRLATTYWETREALTIEDGMRCSETKKYRSAYEHDLFTNNYISIYLQNKEVNLCVLVAD